MKLTKLAIGVALASGTMAAQAGDVLFYPYVVAGGSVTTLVSVINRAILADPVYYFNNNGTTIGTYNPISGFRYLHWSFAAKTADTATAPCEDRNGFYPTSPLDLVTYDVAGVRGTNGLMFEPTGATSNLGTGNNAFGTLKLANTRAFLFVTNAATRDFTNGTPVLSDDLPPILRGDAMILEYDTGAAWGYNALGQRHYDPAATPPGVLEFADFDFSYTGPIDYDISFAPQNEVTTRVFVTPTNHPPSAIPPGLPGGGSMVVSLGKPKTTLTTDVSFTPPNLTGASPITVYDRDESGFSSTDVINPITCVYPVDIVKHPGNIPALVVSPVVTPYVLAQGGWSHLRSTLPIGISGELTPHAVGIKLDFRPAGGNGNNQFGMPDGTGAFNNSFVLPFLNPLPRL